MKSHFIRICVTLFAFFLAPLCLAQDLEAMFGDGTTEEAKAGPEAEAETYADEDDGAVILSEVTYLSLPADDSAIIYRGILGYTFEVGFQLGAGFTGFHLERPCLPSQPTDATGVCPPSDEPDDTSDFAGPTAMIAWDLELVQGWFGFQITAMGTFPVTSGALGWVVEAGASPYFSFEALSKDNFDMAVMAGVKYVHADVEVDHYELQADEIMPSWGLMYQF